MCDSANNIFERAFGFVIAGLQRSVCNELFKATRQITESLSAAISVVTDPPAAHMLGEIPEALEQQPEEEAALLSDGDAETEEVGGTTNDEVANTFSESIKALEDGIAKTAAELKLSVMKNCQVDQTHDLRSGLEDDDGSALRVQFNLNAERKRTSDADVSSDVSHAGLVPEPPPAPAITLKQILALDLNIESITRYQAKPKSMYTFLCAQQFRRDEYSWHFKNVHSDVHGGLSGWLEHRCPLAHYGCTYSTRRIHPEPKGSKLVHNNIIEAFGVQPFVPNEHTKITPFRKSSLSLKSPVSVDFERQTNGFVASTPNDQLQKTQDVDRTKESTPEILTSKDYDSAVRINGNANLIARQQSKEGSHQIVCDNSDAQNSNFTDAMEHDSTSCDDVFAVIDNSSEANIPRDCDMLTSLPFEVLVHISGFLDPFSLGNVALTCRALRDVACSLLETRGIVLLHWERQRVGPRLTWQTTYKVRPTRTVVTVYWDRISFGFPHWQNRGSAVVVVSDQSCFSLHDNAFPFCCDLIALVLPLNAQNKTLPLLHVKHRSLRSLLLRISLSLQFCTVQLYIEEILEEVFDQIGVMKCLLSRA